MTIEELQALPVGSVLEVTESFDIVPIAYHKYFSNDHRYPIGTRFVVVLPASDNRVRVCLELDSKLIPNGGGAHTVSHINFDTASTCLKYIGETDFVIDANLHR